MEQGFTYLFPLGLPWIPGCSVLEAGARVREPRMFLGWVGPADGQGRRVNKNLPESGRATTDRGQAWPKS